MFPLPTAPPWTPFQPLFTFLGGLLPSRVSTCCHARILTAPPPPPRSCPYSVHPEMFCRFKHLLLMPVNCTLTHLTGLWLDGPLPISLSHQLHPCLRDSADLHCSNHFALSMPLAPEPAAVSSWTLGH